MMSLFILIQDDQQIPFNKSNLTVGQFAYKFVSKRF